MSDTTEIFEGRVFSIMNFGAFVRLKDGSTGLVHISEITNGFVQNVSDYLKVGQTVKVMILSVEDDGKKKFSIKRVADQPRLDEQAGAEIKSGVQSNQKKIDKKHEKRVPSQVSISVPPAMYDEGRDGANSFSFEDKLAKFMKSSEERLVDVKHQTESKRGGGYIRR